MATEDDQRLKEIQREYLDFLDDDVSILIIVILKDILHILRTPLSKANDPLALSFRDFM